MSVRYKAYSYAYLLMAVHKSVARARESEHQPFVDCLNTLLYSALAAEAFLNHVGARVFPHWAPLKKKLTPIEKLEVIAAAKGIKIDWGVQPYQALSAVMRFRNLVVHAETSSVDSSVLASDELIDRGHWQSYCRIHIAEQISSDVESLIKNLPGELGVSVPPAFLLSEVDSGSPAEQL